MELSSHIRLFGVEFEGNPNHLFEECENLDLELANSSFEITHESIFLYFDSWSDQKFPLSIKCWLSRPVMGLKKEIRYPWRLFDLHPKVMKKLELKSHSWSELFNEIAKQKENFPSNGQENVLIVFQRLLRPQLELRIEVFFIQ
jgi:hypothetical protein